MSRSMQIPSQQKLAEKLTILCDRGNGMLTRIYNIKKMLGTADSKPTFLSDKALEPAMKLILRKFPNIDTKSNSSAFAPVQQFKVEIIRSLSLYYDTFADIMDFKDHASELLTTMDACNVQFDITLNYDLTKSYLDLIATYLSIMILVSRVEDRKFVLGLFAAAHDFHHNSMAPNFPRLGQMILDYEQPLRKLCEDFIPHAKLVTEALISVQQIYPRRCMTATEWRSQMMLSLVSEPSKLMNPAQSETIHCEYLSMESIEKWIICGFMLCHQNLAHQVCAEMWKRALQYNYVMTLCRDEVLQIHPYIINYFEGIKNYNKRVTEVKDMYHFAAANAPLFHKERRKFLRTVLKELATVFTDQPGLLGPKALYVFMALSYARDEVTWLLRHYEHQPPKKGNIKVATEDFHDRQLPEMLFHIEELRSLVKKYNQVMQRYYIQYLNGYDAAALNQMMQSLSMCSEDESDILSSFHATMAGISVKQVEMDETFDFTALRLDWFRLQCYSSVSKSSLHLREHRNLANHMNSATFHSKMVDYLDEMLKETSDLSCYCFFTNLFEHQFRQCMEFTAQHRYSIAFPMICSHFMNATHELCPEERHSIGTTSIQYANWFLKEMSEEVNQVITAICDEHCKLADQLLPKHAATALIFNRRKKERGKQKVHDPVRPGAESERKHREEFTMLDRLHMALTELCYALNYHSIINVWNHGFVPREFFVQHLEARFNKALVGMTSYNPETHEIAKPTELLNSVKAMMSVLQTLEDYIHIDISRVFNNVMPQQTQHADSFSGEKTITANYTTWYLEVLLRQASSGHMIVYSPNQKAFVSSATDEKLQFNAEDYADIMELRALAELIGPYGMRHLGEQLMHHVAAQVKELKKLVIMNKEILQELRYSFNQPERMRELAKRLQNVDNLLQRMTIIGVLLSFRALAQEALNDTLELRIPFLLSSIEDFQHYVPNGQDSMIVNDMASAAGLSCNVDPVLCAALRQQKTEVGEDDHNIACLLMVFIAVGIPRLAANNATVYRASLGGHANNSHCLAKAINTMASALFTIHGHGPGDIEDRLKEFLALASNSLLRLGQETDKEQIRNRESVYLLLDQIVQESNYLTMDLLESCFPYVLLRNAYHAVHKSNH